MKTAAIVSGGMDSVTLAHLLQAEGDELVLLAFDYGQRHRKEVEYARRCAVRLAVPFEEVDLAPLARLLQGSSLTSPEVAVPDGHYAEESMRVTVVANRNAIMLNIAAGYAVANGFSRVAVGVHGGDHFIYPDCRPAFIQACTHALQAANEGFACEGFEVHAPFLNASKSDIAHCGSQLGVPWHETWSCYKGGELHCGTCGTCVERREAFTLAGIDDPTRYLSSLDPSVAQ